MSICPVKGRLTGIVSRGGILARWMLHHHKQNPLHPLASSSKSSRSDVSFSLGIPASCALMMPLIQLAELKTLGQLTRRAWEHDVQVMVEGRTCADGSN